MSSASHPTVARLLAERADALVGRDRELAVLLGLLEADGPQVAYVHGVAGAGKSTLVRAFAARARMLGAATVQLEGAEVEPTGRGLEAALGAVLPGAGDATNRLAALGGRVVLVLDAVERLRLLDDWLRRAFIPSLSQHVRVLLAGRERPDPTWAAAYGELMIELPLGNLSPSEVATLLARARVSPSDVVRINRVARGHPLSLQLAASALAARPDLPLEQVATTAVVDRLASLYLGGLDAPARRTLDASALVRRVTQPLLRAMVPEIDADEAFALLETLPFTQLGSDGLGLHDTVREALDAALRARDPARRRRLRAAAYRHLRSELRSAEPADLWRATADMLHLIDNPLIRDGFLPPGEQRYAVEPAAERDGPAIAAIARRHEPPASADLLAAWLDAAPETFRVALDRDGEVTGVIALCEPSAVPLRVLGGDPVAARGGPTCAGDRCDARSGWSSCGGCSAASMARRRARRRRTSGWTPSAPTWSSVPTCGACTPRSAAPMTSLRCWRRSASPPSRAATRRSATRPITPSYSTSAAARSSSTSR